MFRPFEPWMECFITADPSSGYGGDPSTAQVYVRNSSPQYLHLATGEGQIDLFEFAHRLKEAGDWATAKDGRPAEIIPEDDGLGLGLVRKLVELKARVYVDPKRKKHGWHTGPAGWASPFEYLIQARTENWMEFLDRRTVLQMMALQNERDRAGEIVAKFPDPKDPAARKDPTRSRSGDLVKTAAMAATILLTQRARDRINAAKGAEVEPAAAWQVPWKPKVAATSTWAVKEGREVWS